MEFSARFDGGAWSSWESANTWSRRGVSDGQHVLEVLARDYAGNISRWPAVSRFEVDATPAAPVVTAPVFGQPVRGAVAVRGTVSDPRFTLYRLEYRAAEAASWDDAVLVLESTTPVDDGSLGTWNTSSLADGGYDLRLSVTDSLGLVGSVTVAVVVDNHAPYFDQTAPATISASAGGDVYTTNAETHLYFPPHGFEQDVVVTVTEAAPGSVPASLPSGGTKVLDGWVLAWDGALKKAARFTMSFAGASLPAGAPALYRSADGAGWERLGGTVEPDRTSISLAVSLPGRYALFVDGGAEDSSASLSSIGFTPRVFSPRGSFADRRVGISFRLGRAAPVTVKVFSMSGRLIREVVAGQSFQAGDNLIHWDGTDRDGSSVLDGVYVVTVESLGQTLKGTLAVVK
jgi:hypothetical protein